MFESENIIVSFMTTSIVISLFLNILVIGGLWKKSSTMSIRDILLISLSLCNFTEIGFGYTIELYARFHRGSSLTLCHLAAFSTTFCSLTSMLHITFLAVERYLTIVCPLKSNEFFKEKKSHALYFVVPAWLNGLIWASAPFFGWGTYKQESLSTFRCSVMMNAISFVAQSYNYGLLLFCYLLPITIIIWCCYQVNEVLKNIAKKERQGNEPRMIGFSEEAEKTYFQITCIIISAFFISWTPYACVALWFTIFHNVSVTLVTYSEYFANFFVITNPIIYIMFYKDCRKAIKKMICGDSAVAPLNY